MTVPPNAKTAEWTSDDAINLRNFLESVTGQRFLVHVAESCPELLDGGDVNKTLVRSGEVKGHSASINLIVSLTVETPQTTPQKPLYPDLDDDSAWDENSNPK